MNGPEPLTGEPLALDLVNTLAHEADGPFDHLADAEGLTAWLGLQTDRLPVAEAVTAAALEAVTAVRAHAADAIERARRGERPSREALDGLNAAQRAAPAIRYAEWDGAAVAVTPRRCGPSGLRVSAVLAEAVVDLLADPAVTGVRDCEADDCTMLFLPAHPRRRWCSAARCGNRARVARYYQRHKGS